MFSIGEVGSGLGVVVSCRVAVESVVVHSLG
jgi:hypothetical protein